MLTVATNLGGPEAKETTTDPALQPVPWDPLAILRYVGGLILPAPSVLICENGLLLVLTYLISLLKGSCSHYGNIENIVWHLGSAA